LETASAGLSVIIRSNLEKSAARQAVNPRNFFSELKRRNVYKVAIAYGVVAWLLIQIATQVFPFLEIPNWAIRLVIMLIVIGFPIALVIAWAFELTPEGLKRTEFADELPKKPARSRAWIYVVVIAGAISIGLFFLGRFTAAPKQSASADLSLKSIAVLPFENLSHDPDNAYFADGIQEEILTRLSKIGDLKVISRTSTQRFKSAPNNLLEIAKQLGVANILEGSVQRSADQVRVNVQLIKAATDAHLWADTFDRKLTDIFAVESEIAKAVADTLQAKLSGAEQSAIAARPTENSEAHELYLRGRYFLGKRTADDFKRAIDYFNQAIAKDPNYALAYAGIADSYSISSGYSDEPPADALHKARLAAGKALSIDDKLAEAHVSMGLVLDDADLNLNEARREFERAIELNPNYADAHYSLGFDVLAPLGDFDRAISEMNRAIELDPFSVMINANLGFSYILARRYPEAIVQLRKTTELNPDFVASHVLLGLAYEVSGQREQAITECQRAYDLDQRSGPQADPLLLATIYALKGERAKALQQLDEGKALAQRRALFVAVIYVRLGDKNEAIAWLQRSYQNKDFRFIAYINVLPQLDPLRSDPRFEALAEKVIPRNAK
jgi:TolB-like protein/Flp pilus assembly protein TadD